MHLYTVIISLTQSGYQSHNNPFHLAKSVSQLTIYFASFPVYIDASAGRTSHACTPYILVVLNIQHDTLYICTVHMTLYHGSILNPIFTVIWISHLSVRHALHILIDQGVQDGATGSSKGLHLTA